jgi:hypothetical protein
MQKAPVTMRSVIARINRRLKPDLEMLKVTRGERLRQNVGDYYIIDFRMNAITHNDVDPEKMARDLGVLKEYEQVVE